MPSFLSKSSFITGQQCEKLLWLSSQNIKPSKEIDDSAKDRLKVGDEVGNLAKQIFSGGVEIGYEKDITKMTAKTNDAILAEKTIYEATFQIDDILIRVDLMTKTDNGWNMYEVKSSSTLKPYHKDDASFQWYALSRIPDLIMNKAFVITVDGSFVKNDHIDLKKYFHQTDLTNYVNEMLDEMPIRIEAIRKTLKLEAEPNIKIGAQCSKPHACQYKNDCWGADIDDSILSLYRLKSKDKFELYHSGVKNIKQLPADYNLSEIQKKQVSSILKSEPIIDSDEINNFIELIKYPISYLDFETFQEAVPSYNNQSPYQQMPFQFSLHVQHESNEELEHFQFIAEHGDDPRLSIGQELLKNIPKSGTIIAYNQSFEINCIKTLAASSKDHEDNLLLLNDRFLDLIIPFRKGYYYHPQFNGSFSIKKVLPALCPDEPSLNYEKLNITNGGDASLIYKNLNQINPNDYDITLSDLYAYCRLDTLAMVKILEHLRSINN